MDEFQHSVLLLSRPVNAEKNWATPEFNGVKYQTSNHHKDLSLNRIQRDHYNAQKMFEFLAECISFYIHTVLINLNSGEVADESVNAFQPQAIGKPLIQCVVGTSAFDYKFWKKDMAISIKTNASVSIEE